MSLLDDIKRLKEQTQRDARKRADSVRYSRTSRVREDAENTGKFIYQVSQGISWIWSNIVKPLARYSNKPVQKLWSWYKKLWSYCVYRRDDQNVLLFSKTRAGLFILASFVFFWFLLLPTIDFVYEAGLYTLTSKTDDNIYLFGSQEINSKTGEHNIEGCYDIPCSNDEALYFRTQLTVFNEVWSVLHGRGLFYPEKVAGAVPYNVSICKVTHYGIRWRLVLKLVNMYSYVLAVNCNPLLDKG